MATRLSTPFPAAARGDRGLDQPPLEVLAQLAGDAGAPSIADEARRVAERVAEGRFHVACVGQFKRGKSTLLNALVGAPVLPTGVVPVTSVVTVIRHGPRPAARARFADGGAREVDPAELSRWVSEEGNPNNEKGVSAVEVFLPSPLLGSGMCFVDTPGLGSVFEAAAAATRAFVPQIDAALVVLGADPPISGEELALVEEVARQVRDLVFVLGKADRLPEIERGEARAFAERVLRGRLDRPIGPIVEVSGTEQLSGRLFGGWNELVRRLDELARRSGSALVRAAEERAVRRLVERLLHELAERRDALERPLDESERRIAELRRCVAEAERSIGDLGVLLHAEQLRLRKRFLERQEEFLVRALPESRRELEDAVRALTTAGKSALHGRAMALAQHVAERWLERWRAAEEPRANETYGEAAARFVAIANRFLEELRSSGGPALDRLPADLSPEVGFRVRTDLYYTEMMPLTARSPLEWLLDIASPRAATVRAVGARGAEYLERLLRVNTSRIVNDFDRRVVASRARLEAEVRAALAGVHDAAARALETARARNAEGADAIRAELERIDSLERRAGELRGRAE